MKHLAITIAVLFIAVFIFSIIVSIEFLKILDTLTV